MSALFGNQNVGFRRRQIEQVIKAGDPVKITLAYAGRFEKLEFEGFVRWLKPNVPTVTIECEDAIYLVRQKQISENYGKTTLQDVLRNIVQDTGVQLASDVPEVNFDQFIIKDSNGAQALEKLRDSYGLFVFIDDNGELFAGLRQSRNIGENVTYDLYRNVVAHDLRFRRSEDVRLSLRVIGVRPDNTQLEVVVGDLTGEQRTLFLYNVTDKATLQKLGEAELDLLKYDGYEGTLTGFLVPFATRGMNATIVDRNYPERTGSYFIPKVVTTFGTQGARRKVELANKLS
ncbi:MAG: late control protein [Bacteroidota bacterium]